MYVTVNVQLAPDETLRADKQTHDAAAEILKVFGGDSSIDTCSVTIAQTVSGTVGPALEAPVAPEVE